jgi:glyoxylase-like metal-dependent hydrolase (beta-lactamase superfamily II)
VEQVQTQKDTGLYLKQMEVGPMANFVYLVGDRYKKEVFVVAPAWQMDAIFHTADDEGHNLTAALVTHSHYDHCNGINQLLERKDVPIYVNAEEADFARSLGRRTDNLFGDFPDSNLRKVRSGEKIYAGDIEITFIHTPGHTPGSQCFLVNNNLISGDTLFVRGCGRCDLPGGDPKKMYESLTQKLMKLPDDTVLFPGHFYGEEPVSRLKDEKVKNPYMMCGSYETFLKMAGGQRA